MRFLPAGFCSGDAPGFFNSLARVLRTQRSRGQLCVVQESSRIYVLHQMVFFGTQLCFEGLLNCSHVRPRPQVDGLAGHRCLANERGQYYGDLQTPTSFEGRCSGLDVSMLVPGPGTATSLAREIRRTRPGALNGTAGDADAQAV